MKSKKREKLVQILSVVLMALPAAAIGLLIQCL